MGAGRADHHRADDIKNVHASFSPLLSAGNSTFTGFPVLQAFIWMMRDYLPRPVFIFCFSHTSGDTTAGTLRPRDFSFRGRSRRRR
jgi:hypothetical protein